MREQWLLGLAANPAAPVDLLLRLLHEAAVTWPILCGTRPLPQPVIDAILSHPSLEPKTALAVNELVDSRERIRLLDSGGPAAPGWFLQRGAESGYRLLHEDAIHALLAVESPYLMTTEEWLGDLLFSYGGWIRHAAATHPLPRVRARACSVWEWFNADTRYMLANDEHPEVRAAIVEQKAYLAKEISIGEFPPHHTHGTWFILGYQRLSGELIDHVLAKADPDELETMARNKTLPADVVAIFAQHEDPGLRVVAANREDLTDRQVEQLMTDPDQHVRNAIALNLRLTEAQREQVRYQDMPPSRVHYRPIPFWNTDLELSMRQAASVHPGLRRIAARDHRLPDDLALRLAQDSDHAVRLLVSLHHPAIPGDLLLESYLECHSEVRTRLIALPHFPNTGLAKYSSDPDPEVRLLALLDIGLSPEQADELVHDADLGVRQKAAACPRLPIARIDQLLHDGELAQHAAANPALPVDVMWRLLG